MDIDETEIPFGVGVSARGVHPDTENPFDTGAANPGYDETGEINDMDRFPSSSSRRGSEDTTYRRTHGETSFIEGIDEHTPLIRKENELNDSVDEIKRKFPNADTSKFISEIDEYGRVKVKLIREGGKYHLLFNSDGAVNEKIPRTIKDALGTPAEDYSGYTKTPFKYPSKETKFEDEGGRASDGNLVPYIENTEARNQYEYFLCPVSHGLTSAGLSRINQSIESFCYAILGSQVDVRSSISGSQGSAIETQRQFLSMVEDAIRNPEISKSVQRFQLAIESAKVRLDLAISPGLWLLPSKMVVNTESVVGYNNKLKKATRRMRIGVSSDLNIPVRRSALKHNLGSRAVKLPHSGVETRVVKSGTKEKQVVKSKTSEKRDSETGEAAAGVTKETKTVSTSHENNLNVLIIVAGGLAWFLFR